jgi:chorismate dehydratase
VSAPTRLGDIAFANCFPIRWGLRGATREVSLVPGSPRRLGRELLTGGLDVSPVSLIDYLTHANELVLLPDLALGSDGPVQSCVLLSRVPLEELDGAAVGLSSTSRTTALLATVLLERLVGVRPRYVTVPQSRHAPVDGVDAMVLIGDDALLLRTTPPAGWTVYDTGELWRRWTGLPMVFAVWAVRHDYADRQPERVIAVRAALRDAVDRAAAGRRAVARAAADAYPEFSERVLARYFTAIRYDFGARQRASVNAFAALVPGASAVARARRLERTAR